MVLLYKVAILILSIFIISCSSDIASSQFEYKIIEKSFNYEEETGNINAYCLIESIYDLFFVTVNLINYNNENLIVSFDLLMDNMQDNEFSYVGDVAVLREVPLSGNRNLSGNRTEDNTNI